MEQLKNKEWLQKQINRLGNPNRVSKEFGLAKNTVLRWCKRHDIQMPKVDPLMPFQNKEWLAEAIAQGETAESIAQTYNVRKETVLNNMLKMGLSQYSKFLSKAGEEEANRTFKNKYWLFEQMQAHKTAAEVARQNNLSETTVNRYLKKFGYNRMYETRNERYKNIEWLMNEYRSGKTVKEVAEFCNITDNTLAKWNQDNGIDIKAINDEHKYLYKDKDWLIENLEKYGSGLQISKATGFPPNSINRYIQKHGLRPKRKVADVFELNHNYFEVIDNQDKAYWLGFIMADGNVYERKDGNYDINIQLAIKDKPILEKFVQSLDSNIPVIEKINRRYDKEHLSCYVKFKSNKMAKDLAKNGINPKKTEKEIIPNTVPKELVWHFVRGYFDGDGSSSQSRFSICCSHFLKEQIIELFKSIDIPRSAIKIAFPGNVITLTVNRKKEVEKIAKHLYQNANIYLERKRENYNVYF